MGCGSSASTAVDKTATTYPTKQSNAQSKSTTKSTLKDWSEKVSMASVDCRTKYSQPPLPDHYTEEELQFNSDQITDNEWKTVINSEPSKTLSTSESLNWPYKKLVTKYSELENCLTVEVNLAANSDRKQVLAVGGAYIGCNQSDLEQVFSQLSLQSVHSIVFCGNLFDLLGMEPLHEAPSNISQLVEKLESKDTVLAALRMIATKDVKVYYLRGSFDVHLPVVAMERYLGEDITYVQEESLLISVDFGGSDRSYRARFTSGSQWDVLNYSDLPENQLVCSRPIGYYLARAAIQNSEYSSSNLIAPLVRGIPASQENIIIDFIAKQPIHHRITEQLLRSATGLNSEEILQIKCLVGQAKYINASALLEYPYLKFISDKVGKDTMSTMLKVIGGDYAPALSQCNEDVFISGLNDSSSLQKVKGKSGDILVGCPGSLKHQLPQAVRVTFPKMGMNGKVELVSILQILKSESPKLENGSERVKLENGSERVKLEEDNSEKTPDENLDIEDL